MTDGPDPHGDDALARRLRDAVGPHRPPDVGAIVGRARRRTARQRMVLGSAAAVALVAGVLLVTGPGDDPDVVDVTTDASTSPSTSSSSTSSTESTESTATTAVLPPDDTMATTTAVPTPDDTDTTATTAAPPIPPPLQGCDATPGSPTDLAVEPQYSSTDGERWSTHDGCPVRLDVLVTRRPPPDYHCEGWPPSVVMGIPLGAAITSLGSYREFVRDPDGFFGNAELQAGFDPDAEVPPTAFDTGYRHGPIELWMDPADGSFLYLVGAGADGATERWPLDPAPKGCA